MHCFRLASAPLIYSDHKIPCLVECGFLSHLRESAVFEAVPRPQYGPPPHSVVRPLENIGIAMTFAPCKEPCGHQACRGKSSTGHSHPHRPYLPHKPSGGKPWIGRRFSGSVLDVRRVFRFEHALFDIRLNVCRAGDPRISGVMGNLCNGGGNPQRHRPNIGKRGKHPPDRQFLI